MCNGKHHMLRRKSYGLLVLRLGLGAIFIAHGIAKINGMDGTIGFFGSLGFPAVAAYVVTYVEVIGGIAILLGVFTRVAAGLLAVVMAVVILYVKQGAALIGGQSVELELSLLVSTVALMFMGPGKFALSRLFCKKGCGCMSCDGGKCENCAGCANGTCDSHEKNTCDGCADCKGICTNHEVK